MMGKDIVTHLFPASKQGRYTGLNIIVMLTRTERLPGSVVRTDCIKSTHATRLTMLEEEPLHEGA